MPINLFNELNNRQQNLPNSMPNLQPMFQQFMQNPMQFLVQHKLNIPKSMPMIREALLSIWLKAARGLRGNTTGSCRWPIRWGLSYKYNTLARGFVIVAPTTRLRVAANRK